MPNYYPPSYNPPYPQWQNPYFQPQMQMPPQQQNQRQRQSRGNVIRVMGPESAMSYPMEPDMEMVMFDAYNPTFYLVSTDDSGFKTLRTFDGFEERKQVEVTGTVEQIDTSDFATKEDLADIKSDIASLTEMMKGLM